MSGPTWPCVNRCGVPVRQVTDDDDEAALDGIAWVHEDGAIYCDVMPPQAEPGSDGTGAPVFEVQWHAENNWFYAAFWRDGQPWVLNGALTGMGSSWWAAVHDLHRTAVYLVTEGENRLTNGVIPVADRRWLFNQLDPGLMCNEESDAMHAALRAAEQAGPAKEDSP